MDKKPPDKNIIEGLLSKIFAMGLGAMAAGSKEELYMFVKAGMKTACEVADPYLGEERVKEILQTTKDYTIAFFKSMKTNNDEESN